VRTRHLYEIPWLGGSQEEAHATQSRAVVRDDQPDAREGQAGCTGVAHRAVDRGQGAVDGERVFIGGIVSREKSARGGEA
jgi:hypothetical protein